MRVVWSPDHCWPSIDDRSDGFVERVDVPEWASQLSGFGHWLVRTHRLPYSHRAILIVPVRKSAALWVMLGAMIAVLESSAQRDVEVGRTVWFLPRGAVQYVQGEVIDLSGVDEGMVKFRTRYGKGAKSEWGELIEIRPRHDVIAVDQRPSLELAKSAARAADILKDLGLLLGVEHFLLAENAIRLAGSEADTFSTAELLALGGARFADLLLLQGKSSATFSICRFIGDSVDDKARMVVIDGPRKLAILEDPEFQKTDLPAVALLTEDEWCAALSGDSDRLVNALENWGGSRLDEWPSVPIAGIGGLIYVKEHRHEPDQN